ncbi:MAG: 30S ribosomal protein S20 [Dehalococcoidia bacterium]|nr:30S ribosomal protein S20 [Dehalococcoidia bacterium]
MANIKSAIKMIRVSLRKRAFNKPVRSGVKTHLGKVERLIKAGDVENARTAMLEAFSALDKAALKGIVHPNAASRHKSRMAKKLNSIAAAQVK